MPSLFQEPCRRRSVGCRRGRARRQGAARIRQVVGLQLAGEVSPPACPLVVGLNVSITAAPQLPARRRTHRHGPARHLGLCGFRRSWWNRAAGRSVGVPPAGRRASPVTQKLGHAEAATELGAVVTPLVLMVGSSWALVDAAPVRKLSVPPVFVRRCSPTAAEPLVRRTLAVAAMPPMNFSVVVKHDWKESVSWPPGAGSVPAAKTWRPRGGLADRPPVSGSRADRRGCAPAPSASGMRPRPTDPGAPIARRFRDAGPARPNVPAAQ